MNLFQIRGAAPNLFIIQAKDGKLIGLDLNTVQNKVLDKLTNRTIILKARQMGISTLVQADIFTRLISEPTRALSLAKDDDQTEHFRNMQDIFYDNFPRIKEVELPQRIKTSTVLTRYDNNSSHTIRTAGGAEPGRGETYNFIHGSEVAFWKDPERIIAGALQAGNPQVILESTANGAGGWFYETCMDSLAQRNDWNLIFIPYTEFDEYKGQEWINTKKKELGRYFSQEYPSTVLEAFLTSSSGYFSDIDVIFRSGSKNSYISGHKYSAGLDFAQSKDYTVMIVVDRTTRQMVDYLHINKMSWELQRQEIRRMYNRWNLRSLKAESNSIGEVNIEELEKEGLEIERFNTDNTSKNQIMQRLHEELETGFELMDWDILRSELNTMISKRTPSGKWTVQGDGNSHDDTVIALALAVTAKINKYSGGAIPLRVF